MPHSSPPPESVIVTTQNALRAIVADEVHRAVKRALADLVEDAALGDEWFTPRQAVKFYGRSRSTLHRWAKDGTLPSRKIAGSVYYSRAALSRMAGTPRV